VRKSSSDHIITIKNTDLCMNRFVLKRRVQWRWFFSLNPLKKNRSKLVKFLWIQFDFFKKAIPFCFSVKNGFIKVLGYFELFLSENKLKF